MNKLKIPGTFYIDHLSRFYGEGVWSDYDMNSERWAGRYVHVILTDDQFDELFDDAEFYSDGAGGLDSQYAGIVKSAQATVKHMQKYDNEMRGDSDEASRNR